MIREEIYKTAIRFYLLPIIICTVAMTMYIRIQDRSLSNIMLEYYKADYLDVMERNNLDGRWSEEKQRRLDLLINENDALLAKRSETTQKYLSGQQGYLEYNAFMNRTQEAGNIRIVLQQLESQYTYASTHSDTYYIMYTNGWMKWFLQPAEYMTYLAAILITCVVWLPEYSPKGAFHDVMLTTTNGRKYAVRTKLVLICGCIIPVFALEQAVYLAYVAQHYGLGHTDWPIQSIPIFTDRAVHVSIFGALLILSVLKLLSMLGIALILSAVITTAKAVYPVMLAGSAMCILCGMQIDFSLMWTRALSSYRYVVLISAVCVLVISTICIFLHWIWQRRE